VKQSIPVHFPHLAQTESINGSCIRSIVLTHHSTEIHAIFAPNTFALSLGLRHFLKSLKMLLFSIRLGDYRQKNVCLKIEIDKCKPIVILCGILSNDKCRLHCCKVFTSNFL